MSYEVDSSIDAIMRGLTGKIPSEGCEQLLLSFLFSQLVVHCNRLFFLSEKKISG
jgi:hypothetical protein